MKIVSILMSVMIGFQFLPDFIYKSPLAEIAEVASEQRIEVTKWKVYIKAENKRMSYASEVEKELTTLMKKHDDYTWDKNRNDAENHVTYIGKKKSDSSNMRILVNVYQYDKAYKMTVSHELTGHNLSETIIDDIQSSYSEELKNHQVFYSVYGYKEAIKSLNVEHESKKLVNAFSAKPVEEMKEKGFHSVSALHDKWETKIPTKDGEEFNLQIGVRADEKEGKLNIAIGTPIITSGY
ncbi:hypothetical protein FZW96_19640 [Bacillus sp. BGMRC 2118]|nr:hypothetical protein FZW96_19640 [Bacillus sp. BGMRC 2118]